MCVAQWRESAGAVPRQRIGTAVLTQISDLETRDQVERVGESEGGVLEQQTVSKLGVAVGEDCRWRSGASWLARLRGSASVRRWRLRAALV